MSRELSDDQRSRLAELLKWELVRAYTTALAAGVPASAAVDDVIRRRLALRSGRLREVRPFGFIDDLQDRGNDPVSTRLVRE